MFKKTFIIVTVLLFTWGISVSFSHASETGVTGEFILKTLVDKGVLTEAEYGKAIKELNDKIQKEHGAMMKESGQSSGAKVHKDKHIMHKKQYEAEKKKSGQ